MMLTAVTVFFGVLAALATLLMLFTRNPVKAAMLMLAALLSTAMIYLALSAQFLAALQVILYAGAVMTLFIVALNVLPLAGAAAPRPARLPRLLGLAAAAMLLTALLGVTAGLGSLPAAPGFTDAGALEIARQLFGPYVYQFELLGLVLFSSLVGAVTLAARRGGAK